MISLLERMKKMLYNVSITDTKPIRFVIEAESEVNARDLVDGIMYEHEGDWTDIFYDERIIDFEHESSTYEIIVKEEDV